jgi:ATP/maltotriose-dependent transcriptional regulator MalT/DNA-binding SARP family transcriptional activator
MTVGADVRTTGQQTAPRALEFGRRRICVVLGAAGWGKTTAVASWVRARRSVWLSCEGRHDATWILNALERATGGALLPPAIPAALDTEDVDRLGAVAADVCERLEASLRDDLVVVVDDLHRLPPRSDAVRLLEGLCWCAPESLRFVLIARREPSFSLQRLRGQGLVADVDAPSLSLATTEIDELLRRVVDPAAGELAELVQERTGGWPAAVRAAVEAVAHAGAEGGAEAVTRLMHPGEPFHTYVAEEVLGKEPSWAQDCLRRIATFGGVTNPDTIGVESPEPAAVLADLTRRGLLQRSSGTFQHWTLLPPLAAYFDHEATARGTKHAGLHAAAAAEYMARGAYGEALRHLVAAGDGDAVASLLIDHRASVAGADEDAAVLPEVGSSDQGPDEARLQQALDEAGPVRGNWTQAFASYQRVAGEAGQLEPQLAWRIMWMLQMQGEFDQVPPLLGNVRLGAEDTLDEAWVLGLVASADRLLGDLVGARRFAHRSLAAARRSGRPSAYGPAHNVLAMLAGADGDRRKVDAHFANALDVAEAAGELVQQLWIRSCRAIHLLEMGTPRDAADEAAALRELSVQCGVPFLQALACTLLGRASLRLGAPDTAAAELATAIELFQRLGSRLLAWPLAGLGDLHRTRGQLSRARASYEEALRTAEGGHDSIGVSHALTGLARVRAADDVPTARRLAERAVAAAEPLHQVAVLLTRGWIELLGGNRDAAARDAARAGAVARGRRDDLGLAEAILLSVLASETPEAEVRLLDEAIQIWQEAGCRLEECVARIVAGRFGSPASKLEAERAAQTLRASGVDLEWRRAAGPLAVLIKSAPNVSINALGVFQVTRDGAVVAKAEWQSKKARDLLKILVAHRRPVPRDRLQELLWPGVAPGKSGNRLSVLLSTLRDVLQPGRDEGGPLQSDGSTVWLDRSRVRVDVDEFLSRADMALGAHRSGEPDAQQLLMSALAARGGELLEDDPYDEWAAPLSEEIRARHTAVLRALVATFRASGDIDSVIRYGLQLLEQDPYDEEVRLDLVAALLDAGRLGEARRHYELYARRMREIDVEPRPMPRPVRIPPPRQRSR